jgi:hypothetical protein
LELYECHVGKFRQRDGSGSAFGNSYSDADGDDDISWYGNWVRGNGAGGGDGECGRRTKLSVDRQPDHDYAGTVIYADSFRARGDLGEH